MRIASNKGKDSSELNFWANKAAEERQTLKTLLSCRFMVLDPHTVTLLNEVLLVPGWGSQRSFWSLSDRDLLWLARTLLLKAKRLIITLGINSLALAFIIFCPDPGPESNASQMIRGGL